MLQHKKKATNPEGFIHPEASCKELEACFQVPAWSLKNVMKHLNLQRIHHLKLNCEGCEYHVLNDPVIRRMKEEGYIGTMSGELHHFDTFNILPEMVEPAMNIMCQEKLVADNSNICEQKGKVPS